MSNSFFDTGQEFAAFAPRSLRKSCSSNEDTKTRRQNDNRIAVTPVSHRSFFGIIIGMTSCPVIRPGTAVLCWRLALVTIRQWASVLRLAGLSLCTSFISFSASGSSVTFTWGPNVDPDVAGYMLYYGSSSAMYTNAINFGASRTNTVSGLINGAPYYFSVTAYDTAGLESDREDSEQMASPTPATLAVTMRSSPAKILSITPTVDGGFTIIWQSVIGATYRIACKNGINDANWTEISGDIVADGSTTSWNDPAFAEFPSRFYTVTRLLISESGPGE
jgi:hypothetical protein